MSKKIKTERDLIREVIFLYQNSRKTIYPNKKIFRGRSHSISSALEDIVANFLLNNIICDNIYIDQPLTVEGMKGRNPCPDVVIVRDKKITAILDIKTDLGWNREGLFNLCKKKSKLLKLIRDKKCSIRIGTTKEKIDGLIIDNRIVYDVIILSGKNINSKRLYSQISRAKKLNPSIDVFILTEGKHPNTYNVSVKELLSKIKINNNEFKRCLKKLATS